MAASGWASYNGLKALADRADDRSIQNERDISRQAIDLARLTEISERALFQGDEGVDRSKQNQETIKLLNAEHSRFSETQREVTREVADLRGRTLVLEKQMDLHQYYFPPFYNNNPEGGF